MRQLIILFFVLVIAVGIYFSQKNISHSDSDQNISQTVSENQKSTSGEVTSENSAAISSDGTSEADNNEEHKELKAWISNESKVLNQKGVDPKAKDVDLRRRIETMTNLEKDYLIKLAVDHQNAATDRILSTYLLTLDSSIDSASRLTQLASQPLPDHGPINAHSEAELKRNQDLAVRYMAVDQLVERIQNGQTEARDELQKIADNAAAEELRAYAKRQLQLVK